MKSQIVIITLSKILIMSKTDKPVKIKKIIKKSTCVECGSNEICPKWKNQEKMCINCCDCDDCVEEEEGCECGGGHPIMGIMCDGSHKEEKKDWWIAYDGAITLFTGTNKELEERIEEFDGDVEYGELFELIDERKN